MSLGYILYTVIANNVKSKNFKSYLVLGSRATRPQIVRRDLSSDRIKNNGSFFQDIDFTNFKAKKNWFLRTTFIKNRLKIFLKGPNSKFRPKLQKSPHYFLNTLLKRRYSGIHGLPRSSLEEDRFWNFQKFLFYC